MDRQPTYRARVGDALDVLHRALCPYVEREMRAVYRSRWWAEGRSVLRGKPPELWDTSDYLSIIYHRFFEAFRGLGHEGRSRVSLLREVRKRWAHQAELSLDETRRALETTSLLLRAIGASAEADRLERQVLELMQRELQQKEPEPVADDLAGEETAVHPGPPAERAERPYGSALRRGLHQLRSWWKTAPTEPLELQQAILDEVERTAAPYRKQFDFNRLTVHFLAEDAPRRQLFKAVLAAQQEPFDVVVRRRLADARVPVPAGLRVSWRFHSRPPQRLQRLFEARPYCVELQRRAPSTSATVTVLKGRAEQDVYPVRSGTPVTIGRLAEVVDAQGRLVRRNDVAFLDYEDARLEDDERPVQETISRVHAHLGYEPAEAAFCLYDDQSTWGTAVVREGYPVPIQVKQQPVLLQDGDLLYFGRACVRFSLGRPR